MTSILKVCPCFVLVGISIIHLLHAGFPPSWQDLLAFAGASLAGAAHWLDALRFEPANTILSVLYLGYAATVAVRAR